MEMFLMALCMSMFGLAVAALAFAAARPPESSSSAVQLQPAKAVGAARFFTDRVVPAANQQPLLPTEVLLAQIENHVRLEQAAAESFLEAPSHAQLHTKTTSAFVN